VGAHFRVASFSRSSLALVFLALVSLSPQGAADSLRERVVSCELRLASRRAASATAHLVKTFSRTSLLGAIRTGDCLRGAKQTASQRETDWRSLAALASPSCKRVLKPSEREEARRAGRKSTNLPELAGGQALAVRRNVCGLLLGGRNCIKLGGFCYPEAQESGRAGFN